VLVARAVDGTDPVPQSRLGPVVLVAGYGGGTQVFGDLLRALEDRGREAVVVAPVDANTGDLDAQADRLAEEVDDVLDRTGASSVDLVGYSAGGVVARLWVRDHGGDERARRVLTLGSPHHGTDLAGLGAVAGCPTACEQLAPDSALLARLNSGDETPRGPLWASVWTTEDETVVPPDSADLTGALTFTVQSVCPGAATSHGELPGDPVVIAALDSVLGTGPPRPPTGVSCG
jgi:triacylglycerol esterase/lipase EstA (alpha/beta hydrolase family)